MWITCRIKQSLIQRPYQVIEGRKYHQNGKGSTSLTRTELLSFEKVHWYILIVQTFKSETHVAEYSGDTDKDARKSTLFSIYIVPFKLRAILTRKEHELLK